MSFEVKVGQATRDILGAASDAASSNLVTILRSEGLNDTQITRAISVMRATLETVGLNGVNQLVSIFNDELNEIRTRNASTNSTPSNKSRLFG